MPRGWALRKEPSLVLLQLPTPPNLLSELGKYFPSGQCPPLYHEEMGLRDPRAPDSMNSAEEEQRRPGQDRMEA